MRKRVVSLGLALVMAIGVSGVSGISEVRAEYKAVKVEKVGKEVKSKRGEMPKFLKESGVKGVKDDGEHVWLGYDTFYQEKCIMTSDSGDKFYTIKEYTDGTYGVVLGDAEYQQRYLEDKGITYTGGGFYNIAMDKSNWVSVLKDYKKYNGASGVVLKEYNGTKIADTDGKLKKVKQYVVIKEKGGKYEWVGTYRTQKDLVDKSSKYRKIEGEKYLKYKIEQKVLKDGVSVSVVPKAVVDKVIIEQGLKAPLKVEVGELTIYDGNGNYVASGQAGKAKLPLGVKAGTYRYKLSWTLKDSKGKTYSEGVYADKEDTIKVTKVASIKNYAKGYKPKVKVEKKKAYLVFGNKIKRVVINGQELESKKATTKMNVSRVVTKNGTYGYEVYTEDGLVGTGKITVKGLKK